MKSVIMLLALATAATAEWRRCGTYDQTKAICDGMKSTMHSCGWTFTEMCDVGPANGASALKFLEACKAKGVTDTYTCNSSRDATVAAVVDVALSAVKALITKGKAPAA
ncbi:hypothetical protein BGZ63DRAFT_425024 [Mariannaea sp. PMI_226]|nr:hypothetical protein BGZ63DRAFT_425024 [Mariannaea sp. PMI_226]